MDTRQPTTKDKRKRGSNNVNPVQTHSMETRSKAQNAINKRRKQETDPFKMGHILEKVFGFLDADSVKAARQVNPLWSVEGAKILITKCYIKIPRALQAKNSSKRNTMMNNFMIFLSHKAKDFPIIPNIIVAASGDVELWKSLGVLGQQVKSLKLKPIAGQAELLHKLFNLLPNLKYLNCEEMYLYNRPSAIIKVIISTMSKKEKDGSSLTISSVFLAPYNEEELEWLEKLADCKNVMIEELTLCGIQPNVPNSQARIADLLNKLLSTSQNVLKSLTLKYCEYYLSLLEFSCMTALTHMKLDLNFYFEPAQFHNGKFSSSFRFSEKVPNLQEIILDSSSSDRFQSLLETAGTAPSVKFVNYYGKYGDFDVVQLFKAFPNTDELDLWLNENLEFMFRSLWTHGKNLKKLNLHINAFSNKKDVPDLDFFFTGFDGETVNKIKEAPNLDPFTLEELENLRVNPSISNIKKLQQLSIFCHYGPATEVPKRMLTVAAKYEINLLPKNPRVFIKIRNNEGFMSAFEEVSKLPNFTVQF